jgi:ComF family protein
MHAGTGSVLVHALKYGGWSALAAELAERMARLAWPPDVVADRSLVVPVPLSPSRVRERGFNQSELLARPLAARWGIPLRCNVLERERSTRTQTKLTPEQRLANVAGAFRVRDVACTCIADAHIVVVDDVVTTAATLNECGAALIAGGARSVSYVTFGRAPTAHDRRKRLP